MTRKVINMFEELTWQILGEILPRIPDACRCEQCQIDIFTLSLNKLPAHYVTGKRQFEEMMKVKKVEYNTRITEAIAQSVAKVRANPRTECKNLGFWVQQERQVATEYEGPRSGNPAPAALPSGTGRLPGTGPLRSLDAPAARPSGIPMHMEVADDDDGPAVAPTPRVIPAAKYSQYGKRKRY
jgi:competence protein ComFB